MFSPFKRLALTIPSVLSRR